jgi:tetratricopeptide (TPR) repeat protein
MKSDMLFESRIRARIARYYAEFLKNEQSAFHALDSAYERIDAELDNVLDTLAWCHTQQHVEVELEIIDNLARFLWNRGYWDLRLKIIKRALETLDASIHAPVLSRFCCYIAWVFSRRGQQETAIAWAERAKEYLTGDRTLESAFVEHVLAQIALRSSQFQIAEAHLLRALGIYEKQKIDDPMHLIAIADVWDSLGDLNRDWGLWIREQGQLKESSQKFHESMVWYKKLLEFAKTKQWTEKIATASGDLGHIALFLGKHKEALEYLDLGLRYATVVQRRHTIAYCNLGLGQLFATRGSRYRDKAVLHLETALTIYKELGQQDATRQISDMIAELHRPWYSHLLNRWQRHRWVRY